MTVISCFVNHKENGHIMYVKDTHFALFWKVHHSDDKSTMLVCQSLYHLVSSFRKYVNNEATNQQERNETCVCVCARVCAHA